MTTAENKWTKNGFGDSVPKSQAGGKFSKEESQQVRQAVKEYCAAKQISTDRLCSECEHKAELKGAWMEIARQLPHRSVQSVYRHGLRILHPFKRGAWTEKEIESLFDLVAKHGKKWVAIQNSLLRSSDACRDKYREMSEDYVKGRWKEHETAQLQGLIRQHLQADPNTTMQDIGKMIESEGLTLPWSTISKKMVNRSRLSCFKKFQKMTGLYSSSDEGRYSNTVSLSHSAKAIKTTTATKRASATTTTTTTTATIKEENIQENPIAALPEQNSRQHEQDEDGIGDEDMYLLSELADSGATRTAEVSWDTIRVEDAQERWNSLVLEWQQQEGEEATEEALTTYPFYELAQLLLDRKTSAKMAAETVEAVDLPLV